MDARTCMRAPPSSRFIYVVHAIVLTALVLRYAAGRWELRALSRSA